MSPTARKTTITLGPTPAGSPPAAGPLLRLVTWDGGRGQDGIESALATAVGWSGPGKLNMGSRGYSGSSFPLFTASSISDAATWGNFGMLNVKTGGDFTGMANGAYNTTIDSFWNSVPLSVIVKLTWEHEPENNPNAVADAPDWIAGGVQFIHRSAPKIRARTLARGGTPGVDDEDGAGLVLMGFSFDLGSGGTGVARYPTWKWWDQIAEADRGQAFFGVDKYAKCLNSTSGDNILSGNSGDLENMFGTVDAQAGYTMRKSVFETALDKRLKGDPNDTVVGTDTTIANWIPGFYAGLKDLAADNGLEDLCYFHSPTGAASEFAQLNGPALAAWGNCLVDAHGA